MKTLIRAIALAAVVFAWSATPAQAGTISIMIGDADWFGTGLPMPAGPGPWPDAPFDTEFRSDRRSLAEALSVTGAQLTDIYAAVAPVEWCDEPDDPGPECSPNGSSSSLIVPFFGTLESATISMLMGDFQCSDWGAISVQVNGVAVDNFCFSHGYQMAALGQFILTPAMIAAANLDGEIRMTFSLGDSLDFIAFDYFLVEAEVVPEPATLALFGAGMVIVWGRVRRRRASAS